MGANNKNKKAERYRERARKCAELAMQTRDRDIRETLKFIEQQWLDLADQVERNDLR